MLKKISAIFLVLASGLMITATSVRADLAPPGGIDTSPPLLPIPSMPNYYPPQYIPQTLSLLKLEAVADRRRDYDTSSIHIPGGYFAYEAPKSLFPTTADFAFFNYFLPLYLIIFALNYVIEYGVGLFFKISKRPRFALMVLLMNLATHPLLTLALITNFEDIANNYAVIILAELLIVLVETIIVWLWRIHKSKISFITALIQAGLFCFTLNLASFLTGELIAWTTMMYSHIISYFGFCLIAVVVITIIIGIYKHLRRKAKLRETL